METTNIIITYLDEKIHFKHSINNINNTFLYSYSKIDHCDSGLIVNINLPDLYLPKKIIKTVFKIFQRNNDNDKDEIIILLHDILPYEMDTFYKILSLLENLNINNFIIIHFIYKSLLNIYLSFENIASIELDKNKIKKPSTIIDSDIQSIKRESILSLDTIEKIKIIKSIIDIPSNYKKDDLFNLIDKLIPLRIKYKILPIDFYEYRIYDCKLKNKKNIYIPLNLINEIKEDQPLESNLNIEIDFDFDINISTKYSIDQNKVKKIIISFDSRCIDSAIELDDNLELKRMIHNKYNEASLNDNITIVNAHSSYKFGLFILEWIEYDFIFARFSKFNGKILKFKEKSSHINMIDDNRIYFNYEIYKNHKNFLDIEIYLENNYTIMYPYMQIKLNLKPLIDIFG